MAVMVSLYPSFQRAANMIPAHDSPLAALAFDASGTKLATASEKVRLLQPVENWVTSVHTVSLLTSKAVLYQLAHIQAQSTAWRAGVGRDKAGLHGRARLGGARVTAVRVQLSFT